MLHNLSRFASRRRLVLKKNVKNRRVRLYAKKEDSIMNLRNIGISAHIDSGKTTLTERILYYTGRISEIHEVKGKDGVGATMDSMDLEREKGITIKSAATNVTWGNNYINIIDTPGHVDFTIEVERSLRVLDGAVLVLCGVAGVQSQTITVDRQMRRYDVSRLIFINKLDRLGADPWRAVKGAKEKLGINCAAIQVPIGLSGKHEGIVDIITRKAYNFSGSRGEKLIEEEIPENLKSQVEEKRNILIESLVDVDDSFGEKVLMGTEVSVEDIKACIRRAVIARKFVPVLMGSAFKNKGVQLLLDAVIDFLPNPSERKIVAYDKNKNGEAVELHTNSKLPFVGFAFKLEESKFGQLTWIRIYQGSLKKGMTLLNTNIGEKVKVPRLAKMHAAELEDINDVKGGDICAMFGVECATGETFTDSSVNYQMNTMFVPEPVVSLGISIKTKQQAHLLTKALKRFEREDPTFRVSVDQETQEMIVSGMGELHLEIYVERLKREYGILTKTGAPKVAYRETITKRVDFNYLHKKQSGGQGQYAKIIGYIEPLEDHEGLKPIFENKMVGQNIPPGYIPAIQKGFEDSVAKGPIIGNPIERVRMVLTDGDYHSVDSSEFSFRICTQYAFSKAFLEGNASILQPIMNVEIRTPAEYQQAVLTTINKRKGSVNNSVIETQFVTLYAEVPLASMFGYASDLRSATEGKGEFTMEYLKHDFVLPNEKDKIVETYAREKAPSK